MIKNFCLHWNKFNEEIRSRNRFFPNPEWLPLLKAYFENNTEQIEESKTLFRARVFNYAPLTLDMNIITMIENIENGLESKLTQNDINYFYDLDNGSYNNRIAEIKNGYLGFNEKESSAPPTNSANGRANPKGISYLYLCEDEQTCIKEIRPNMESWISMGKFSPIKNLKMAKMFFDNETLDKYKKKEDLLRFILDLTISYSAVCQKEEDYYATQYISEYIKSLGFDGFIFESSFDNKKKCYVIFDPSNCVCKSSRLCKIKDVSYKTTKLYGLDDYV
ncbi:MAG: RES family NAD+ phosphorylase [Candidatus ainarchaeum sp.]|nr:RES family NAD+ phosphorylase [Candidatus ainarchaeum sp.]